MKKKKIKALNFYQAIEMNKIKLIYINKGGIIKINKHIKSSS